MKKVLFIGLLILLFISNIGLNPKRVATNQSQLTLEMMTAKADAATENLPPDPTKDPVPNNVFPIDWSFAAIIEYIFG